MTASTIDDRPLPAQSIFRQLSATPRVFTFMTLLLAGSISLGAKEVARWQYLVESYPTEWGVGQAAATAALSVAFFGFLTARVADRRDPRPLALLAYVLIAVGNLLVGLTLLHGPLPPWQVLVSAVFDGAALGIGGVCVLKIQAAFVRPGAEGAAEILNVLRLGVGGVIGAIAAGLSPSPAATLLASAAVLGAATIGLWMAMRPVLPRRPGRPTSRAGSALRHYLGSSPGLTKVVIVDLGLTLVIPTQLVNLVLFNLNVPQLATTTIASGMAGVLIGRVSLAYVGFRGSPSVIVLATTSALAALQFLSAWLLTDAWLFVHTLVLSAIVTVGSACGTYAQGLVAAIIQQRVVDEHRGGLAGILVVGRNILISLGALLGTLAATLLGAQALVALLAASLVIVIALARGFRCLRGERNVTVRPA